jgi:hypothetical protein
MLDGSNLPDNGRLQQRLALFNAQRFNPAMPSSTWRDDIADAADRQIEEGEWLEARRAAVSERAASAPRDADGFVAWFEELEHSGPGQGDALFPWLADVATMDEMRWFLTQEVAGEAGFDDLAAITQVKLSQQAKLEIARNYWDEMGRGNPKGMHGPMLEVIAERLGLHPTMATTVPESLGLANVMAGLACNRRYAYHSVGALGVIEQTAPSRAILVARGLKRLGVPAEDRHYFDLHAILDVKHSEAWNAEALHPLVAENPAVAPAIAEGALMRLEAGAACFERYRAELWGEGVPEYAPVVATSSEPSGRRGFCVR